MQQGRALLGADECARADRFYFPRDQRRYIIGRAALRLQLGVALGVAPEAVRFTYGSHGKPALAEPFLASGICFNVSHSGDLALIGLLRGGELGVDLEAFRQLSDRDALVRRYFSDVENQFYFSLPQADREAGFYNCWTRKEAVVKALGQGLSYSLRAFDVTLAPQDSPSLLRLQQLAGHESGWCLDAFRPGEGYAAAVAVQGRYCKISPLL